MTPQGYHIAKDRYGNIIECSDCGSPAQINSNYCSACETERWPDDDVDESDSRSACSFEYTAD